ncbi:MAG: hypothetical protein ACOX68_00530 [Candidatus Limivicinus sp.]|jgi:hypothetical protein
MTESTINGNAGPAAGQNLEGGTPETADSRPPIGADELREAYKTLLKYKAAKAKLEERITDNQQWYTLRQWESLRKEKKEQVEPVSGWLFNSIANKHADAMDNFPSVSILPREQGDEAEAEMLSSVLPVVLDACNFEDVYSAVMDDKLISGTGVYGVFWDGDKLNGLGDVDIVAADLMNLFWEAGITDIQQSRNLFYVTLRDNDLLESEYPQLRGRLSGPVLDAAGYVYDESADCSGKSVEVDWYYKKKQGGRTVLHYCKFIAGQDEPLFASENEREPVRDAQGSIIRPAPAETGWYEHGLYPFIFDPLFRSKGTPCGFGYIDVGKNTQEYIDRGDQAIMQNLLFNCKPRHFIRNDGSVNEAEYGDLTKDFVHVDGSLGQDSILPVRGSSLDSIYVTVINNKIDELKETTGNRDVSSGGTTGGATAASAIAAMQEAGSKLSRDSCRAAYRAYRHLILMVIELIRQFYDMPRYFRIMGENGAMKFVSFSNAGLLPQRQTPPAGIPEGTELDMGCRLPVFDVIVTPVKASPYSRLSQNELALQFYSAGFFDPAAADSALACLDMMDFDRKDFVISKIADNGRLYRDMTEARRTALELARLSGNDALAEKLARRYGAEGSPEIRRRKPRITGDSYIENARKRAASASAPE